MHIKDYDFSGWATKSNIKCSDGRTITENAFSWNDGGKVPLVWNHQHQSVDDVLGTAWLENTKGGVRAYGKFNDTENGQKAKSVVQHGDVVGLSIYANNLQQDNQKNVIHGKIREVSLVLAGANPGAYIDEVIAHGDNEGDAAIIYYAFDDAIDDVEPLEHSEIQNGNKSYDEIIASMDDDQRNVYFTVVGELMKHSATNDVEESYVGEEDIQRALASMTDEQLNAVQAMFDAVAYGDDEEYEENYSNEQHYDDDYSDENYEEDDEDMRHNVFENDQQNDMNVLMHAEDAIIGDAQRMGSMRDSFLAHAADYGVEQIEQLFPEPHQLNRTPEFIGRNTDWVSTVMSGVHRSPFSRVKSRWADITADEARARGYIKGKLKKEEVFSLLKRATTPATIYKKQKLDRDDILDITDFDVVAWIKGEMRLMLNEEIARAILIGDGRLASDDDKIPEDHVRPILKDADLFVIRWGVANGSSVDEKCKNFIRACIKARKNYRGSGNPALFTTEDMLTDLLLLEDSIGHKLYKTESELATALRVSRIVTVPVMDGLQVDVDGTGKNVYGIIVNLDDYTVGADKGGEVNLFNDFDIDYNQEKYLMETRISGSLVKPFSAIVLREADATASLEPTMEEAMEEFKVKD